MILSLEQNTLVTPFKACNLSIVHIFLREHARLPAETMVWRRHRIPEDHIGIRGEGDNHNETKLIPTQYLLNRISEVAYMS